MPGHRGTGATRWRRPRERRGSGALRGCGAAGSQAPPKPGHGAAAVSPGPGTGARCRVVSVPCHGVANGVTCYGQQGHPPWPLWPLSMVEHPVPLSLVLAMAPALVAPTVVAPPGARPGRVAGPPPGRWPEASWHLWECQNAVAVSGGGGATVSRWPWPGGVGMGLAPTGAAVVLEVLELLLLRPAAALGPPCGLDSTQRPPSLSSSCPSIPPVRPLPTSFCPSLCPLHPSFLPSFPLLPPLLSPVLPSQPSALSFPAAVPSPHPVPLLSCHPSVLPSPIRTFPTSVCPSLPPSLRLYPSFLLCFSSFLPPLSQFLHPFCTSIPSPLSVRPCPPLYFRPSLPFLSVPLPSLPSSLSYLLLPTLPPSFCPLPLSSVPQSVLPSLLPSLCPFPPIRLSVCSFPLSVILSFLVLPFAPFPFPPVCPSVCPPPSAHAYIHPPFPPFLSLLPPVPSLLPSVPIPHPFVPYVCPSIPGCSSSLHLLPSSLPSPLPSVHPSHPSSIPPSTRPHPSCPLSLSCFLLSFSPSPHPFPSCPGFPSVTLSVLPLPFLLSFTSSPHPFPPSRCPSGPPSFLPLTIPTPLHLSVHPSFCPSFPPSPQHFSLSPSAWRLVPSLSVSRPLLVPSRPRPIPIPSRHSGRVQPGRAGGTPRMGAPRRWGLGGLRSPGGSCPDLRGAEGQRSSGSLGAWLCPSLCPSTQPCVPLSRRPPSIPATLGLPPAPRHRSPSPSRVNWEPLGAPPSPQPGLGAGSSREGAGIPATTFAVPPRRRKAPGAGWRREAGGDPSWHPWAPHPGDPRWEVPPSPFSVSTQL